MVSSPTSLAVDSESQKPQLDELLEQICVDLQLTDAGYKDAEEKYGAAASGAKDSSGCRQWRVVLGRKSATPRRLR